MRHITEKSRTLLAQAPAQISCQCSLAITHNNTANEPKRQTLRTPSFFDGGVK